MARQTDPPTAADQLHEACEALREHILNPDNVSILTGRLKRRVVLESGATGFARCPREDPIDI